MTSSRQIYVDLDDVLSETSRMFLSVLQQDFGKVVTYEELTTFDLGTSCALNSNELQKFFGLIHAPAQLLSIEPIRDAKPLLDRWVTEGYEITIVTGRPMETYDITIQWLVEAQLPYHSLLFVDKYRRSNVGKTATMSLDQLGAMSFCMAVEDSPEMALHLAEAMQLPVALRDCPWNRQSSHNRIKRCLNWLAIDQMLRTISFVR